MLSKRSAAETSRGSVVWVTALPNPRGAILKQQPYPARGIRKRRKKFGILQKAKQPNFFHKQIKEEFSIIINPTHKTAHKKQTEIRVYGLIGRLLPFQNTNKTSLTVCLWQQ